MKFPTHFSYVARIIVFTLKLSFKIKLKRLKILILTLDIAKSSQFRFLKAVNHLASSGGLQ